MNENLPDSTKSLLGELDDINSLLNKAMTKAENLDKHATAIHKMAASKNPSSVQTQQIEDEEKVVKPSNWDAAKNAALQESIKARETEEALAKDTKQVRQINPKTKKNTKDDNWDDDPF